MVFFSLPVQLIIVIAAVLLGGHYIPLSWVSGTYTLSLLIKQLLAVILPFMVFSFVATGITSFKRRGPLAILLLLGMVIISNGLVALISYGVMSQLFKVISCSSVGELHITESLVQPWFALHIPMPFRAEHALLAALIYGIVMAFYPMPNVMQVVRQLKSFVEWYLNTLIIPVLPLFVLGFLLKIRVDGLLTGLVGQYGSTMLVIVGVQILYLIIMYVVASGLRIVETVRLIKNALPSYITAFGTMSSNVTIPVTIEAAVKNTGNKPLAEFGIPILANTHLIGDSISTPILTMTTLILFKGCLPGVMEYIQFVGYFCISMLAVAGVPGGGILVVIPILISQMHCTSEMISIITTLYLLLDSFGTAANVMGDGALLIIVDKVFGLLGMNAKE